MGRQRSPRSTTCGRSSSTSRRFPSPVSPFADSNTASDDSGARQRPGRAGGGERRRPRARASSRATTGAFAEAAYPLSARGPVLVFMAPLTSQVQSVAVVRRRVLIAGGLAIGFAVVLGYAGAAMFARRIRRLESAVERIADGEFTEAVVDPGTDELGPAGARRRADAPTPCPARPGPRRVHRQRLARAADAALLAGGLPGAARRPVGRRGDARGVSGADAHPGRAADEARDRSARPLAARRGPADGRGRGGRPGRARPRAGGRVPRAGRGERARARS